MAPLCVVANHTLGPSTVMLAVLSGPGSAWIAKACQQHGNSLQSSFSARFSPWMFTNRVYGYFQGRNPRLFAIIIRSLAYLQFTFYAHIFKLAAIVKPTVNAVCCETIFVKTATTLKAPAKIKVTHLSFCKKAVRGMIVEWLDIELGIERFIL